MDHPTISYPMHIDEKASLDMFKQLSRSFVVTYEHIRTAASVHTAERVHRVLLQASASSSILAIEVLKCHMHLVSISSSEWPAFINAMETLQKTNSFAVVFLIQKIAFLKSHDLLSEFVDFLKSVRNYTGRGLGYIVGNSTSPVDDVEKNVDRAGRKYYVALMHSVSEHRESLGPACAQVMISAGSLSTIFRQEDLDETVHCLSEIQNKFGMAVLITLIENIHLVMRTHSLRSAIDLLNHIRKHGADYLCFSVAQGLPHIEQQPIESRTRSQLCSVLREYRPNEIVAKPWLFQNLEYAALLRNWPDLQRPAKQAIIRQLGVENYRTEFFNEPQIAALKNEIEAFASDNWYGPWSFSGLTVDVTFARTMLGQIMALAIDKETKTKLFNSNPQLFDRKTAYHRERVLAICTALSDIVTAGPLAEKLSAIYHATIGNHDPLRNLLSSERLWVSLWKRDPWTDYGRSDQMFSCTGLGDYAADSGPSALADIAVNKLDVWDHNELVGRVNLCLVRDFSDKPYLLVDSLEGSDRILKVQAKAQDLMAAIRNFGAPFGEGNVLLNCRTSYNNTPRRFVEYAMSAMKYLPEYKYLRRYTSKTSLGQDAENLKRAYLEAFHTNEDGLVFCAEL